MLRALYKHGKSVFRVKHKLNDQGGFYNLYHHLKLYALLKLIFMAHAYSLPHDGIMSLWFSYHSIVSKITVVSF